MACLILTEKVTLMRASSTLKVSDSELLAKIEKEPKLLRLPLVRTFSQVSIGHDEEGWKRMIDKG